MRVALGQMDCRLGDVEGNLERAAETVRRGADRGADLVVLPELAVHGYALGAIGGDRSIAADDPRVAALGGHGPDVLVGFHERTPLRRYNAAAYLSDGRVLHLHRKLYLPTYRSWEERKHASPGQAMRAYDTPHGRAATLVCNDAWQPVLPWLAVQDAAEILLVPSASCAGEEQPALDTITYWHDLITFTARMQQCWVVFVNRVGEEAGARFWGGSRIVDPAGTVVCEAARWGPDLAVAEVDIGAAAARRHALPLVAEARLGLIAREIDRLIQAGGDA